MNAILTLSLWFGILSLAISYAWWVRLRVWLLRQDLFNLRDELWQQMSENGTLEDESYQQTRNALNQLIRLAPYFSFFVLARILLEDTGEVSRPLMILPQVRTARSQLVSRLMGYMLQESLIGLIAVTIAHIYRCKESSEKQIAKWIDRLLNSRSVRVLTLPDQCSLA